MDTLMLKSIEDRSMREENKTQNQNSARPEMRVRPVTATQNTKKKFIKK